MNHKCHRKLLFLDISIFQDLYTLQMAMEERWDFIMQCHHAEYQNKKKIFWWKYFLLLLSGNINVVMIVRFITATSAQLSHCEILSCFYTVIHHCALFIQIHHISEELAIKLFTFLDIHQRKKERRNYLFNWDQQQFKFNCRQSVTGLTLLCHRCWPCAILTSLTFRLVVTLTQAEEAHMQESLQLRSELQVFDWVFCI